MSEDVRDEGIEELNDFWNGLVRRERVSPGDLDPTLAEAVRRFHARDDAPATDTGFRKRLRRDLLSQAHAERTSANGAAKEEP